MTIAELTVDTPIRTLGAIEYLAARDATGAACLAVAAVAGSDPGATGRLLDDIATAHGTIRHRRVPRLIGRAVIGGRPCVALDCDARLDLHELAQLAFETGIAIDLGAAAGFSIACLEMLDAVHEDTARCLGALSAGNVLVSPGGQFHILGWGHPMSAAARSQLLAAMPPSYQAPSVALGGPAGPTSDLAAATLFFHSFLYLGALPAPVLNALRGEDLAGFEGLSAGIAVLMESALVPRPGVRSIERFLATYRVVLGRLSIDPGEARFERLLAEVAAVALARRQPAGALEIAGDGRWFRIPGADRVDLTRRGTQRRLLLVLARHRVDHPGAALGWEALFAAGWPAQRSDPASARSRVYVAIAALRTQGLRDALQTSAEGYFLDPALPVALGAAVTAPP
jgi:hypothetical protein